MSKLYQLNRMRYAPAAGGGLLSGIVKIGSGLVKGVTSLFKSKAAKVAAQALKNPIVQTGLVVGAGEVAGALMAPGGAKASTGVSGGWGRRRRGITATELRGFHKVARLLHKEGMVVKHARRG